MSSDLQPAVLDRANHNARNREKKKWVLHWLSKFKYSTTTILSASLEVNPTGQTRFFSSLIEQGIVRTVPASTINVKLVLLTPLGVQLALEVSDSALSYQTSPSKINQAQVRHNLAVQLALIHRITPGDFFYFEHQIPLKNDSKIPDALFGSDEHRIALEVELTHKSIPRIYYGWTLHALGLRKGLYQTVEYVFPSDSLKNRYVGLFKKSPWPVYEQGKNRRLQKTDLVVPMTGPVVQQFTFSVDDFGQSYG